MARRAPPAEPWLVLADLVLQREAAIARLGRGAPPREFAGLYIGDEELDRLMGELPGLDGAGAEQAAEVRAEFEERLDEARTAFADSLQTPDSQFAILAWNAGLSTAEAEVFALLAAVELDVSRQRLVAYIQDNVTLPRLTLATLSRLFPPDHPGALAVAEDAALRRACLVQAPEPGPWGSRMVAVAAPVVWSLVGDFSRDPDLPPGVELIQPPGVDGAGAGLLMVVGGDRASRLDAAAHNAAGVSFLISPVPEESEGWEALIRTSSVLGTTIVLEFGSEGLLPGAARHWIERAPHVTWVVSSATEIALESLPARPWREVRVAAAEADEQDWKAALGIDKQGGHRLDREQLRLVSAAYPAVGEDLEAAVRRLAGGHLDSLALRIRPRRGWADLVLPPDHVAQLRELTARYRQRERVYEDWGFRAIPSAGLVALFAGQSGTGKTLSAEIIAGDLGLDVYKIDLSSVVSKYIGETEKNLERIFVAAAAGNLVLFFDEADSIFGKRSEVSDAHDRYANIEVSYLLQRLESYDGLVILATNFKKNIDEAFLRRIHVSVEFPLPEEDERRAIWELSFPATAPTGDLDFEFLAKQFKITGGTIRNAALQAAFLAADADEPISMKTVVLGLRREFQKLGRLMAEEEFGPYHDLVKGEM